MPTYERQCQKCGHEWEQEETVEGKTLAYQHKRTVLNGIVTNLYTTDASICPECGGEAIRLISKTNFVLKGHRWAKDGYNG